jgi:hypothetical protein
LAPRKLALTIFFASVVINATLGIVALFVGEFGDVQGKILLTSLSISAASVLSLAMFPARERGLLGPVPTIGIGLSIIGFGLAVILAWGDFRGDVLGRSAASFLTFAVSAGYVSLIALAVIQPRFKNIVRTVYVLVAVLAVMIVGAMWGEPEDKNILRVMGTLAIVLTAATITIPVLHRLNRQGFTNTARLSDTSKRRPLRCVSCGSTDVSTDDGSTYRCGACQTRFRAEIVL